MGRAGRAVHRYAVAEARRLSPLALLWAAFTESERDRVARALRIEFGERGIQLVIAIARAASADDEAGRHAAVEHEQGIARSARIPMPVPPPAPAPACDDCRRPFDQLTVFIDDDRRALLLCDLDWFARMHARARGPLAAGEVRQPFPIPFPLPIPMPIDRPEVPPWPA